MRRKNRHEGMTDAERMVKAQLYSDIAIGLSIGASIIALLAFILSIV